MHAAPNKLATGSYVTAVSALRRAASGRSSVTRITLPAPRGLRPSGARIDGRCGARPALSAMLAGKSGEPEQAKGSWRERGT